MAKKTKKLACGATGCCHIGYPHHHCDICGMVVYEVRNWGLPAVYRSWPYSPWTLEWGNGSAIGDLSTYRYGTTTLDSSSIGDHDHAAEE